MIIFVPFPLLAALFPNVSGADGLPGVGELSSVNSTLHLHVCRAKSDLVKLANLVPGMNDIKARD